MLLTGNRSCQHLSHVQVSQVGYGQLDLLFQRHGRHVIHGMCPTSLIAL
jgi:hypothetical protein